MTGNRRRTLAQAAAALLGLLMLMAGTVAVIEASAHLLELDPVLLPWRRTSARLADLRVGDGWVRAAGVGFVAVGLLLGVLGTAPRHRRTLAVGGNDRPTWARVDIVDVQRAVIAAAESVPAVASARARWTRGGRLRVTLRWCVDPTDDTIEVVRQQLGAALDRLGVALPRGMSVVRSRRAP
ncbi:MAG TPA: hypothetical protein DEG13_07800 [Candidatus Microthrix parvicella]|nr:hypothetical protein [Candidatus Microthrix parvicella]